MAKTAASEGIGDARNPSPPEDLGSAIEDAC